MKSIYKLQPVAVAAVALLMASSCTYDPYDTDVDPVIEKMTLNCETPMVEIDENNPNGTALTFTWTSARQLPDEYMPTYQAQLDVLGNSFGSKTVITSGVGFDYTYNEETGVYTASFTNEQINNWYNDRWSLPVNKTFTVEFRVIAQWTGGSEFEAPEVRKVSAQVKPIQVEIFSCDHMALSGNAIDAPTDLDPAVENENLYAWKGTLSVGELSVPVDYDGVKYYLHCANGSTEITDGTPMPLIMNETPGAWNIKEAGEYRIVINMVDRTATFYSAATDLQPLSVTFRPNGSADNPEVTLTVSEMWAYGGGTGWGAKKLNLIQSQADPQVFIYDGSKNDIKTLGGDMKFCISNSFKDENGTSYNQNNVYCFTSPLKADGGSQTLTAELGKPFDLQGGAERNVRNSYVKIPSGTNFIVFDLRHKTLTAYKK